MKGKAAFVVGAGVGYLLGTPAGREQLARVKGWAADVWADPRVQGYVRDAEEKASQVARTQGVALKDKAVAAARARFTDGTSTTWQQPVDPADADPAARI